MPSLGRIYAEIGAELGGLRSGEAQARTLFSNISRAGTRAMAALATATAAATGTIVALTARSLSNIDANAKLARAVGGTTMAIQALQRAGDRAGVEASELESGLTRLNQKLGEVIATGKGAEDTFKALGLSAVQLANMDVDERMMAISDAMRRAGMSTQEMSYHLRQLGIRQASVITLMQSGSEEIERSRRAIEDLGVGVTDGQAAAIERANDSLSEMGRVLEGLGNRIAVRVAPMLERMANRFTEMSKEGGTLRTIMDSLTDSFIQLAEVATSEEFLTGAAQAFELLIGLAEFGAKAIIFLSENIETATAIAAALGVAMLGLSGPFGLVAGAVGLAAGAFVHYRRSLEDTEKMMGAAEVAQIALNESLGIFAETGSEQAAEGALVLALAYEEEARKALIAAEANYELAAARHAAVTGFQVDADGLAQGSTNPAVPEITSQYAAAAEELRNRRNAFSGASQTVAGLRMSLQMGLPSEEGEGSNGDRPPIVGVPGLGGGAEVRDQFTERYEALMEGLMSEQELLDAWRQESEEILAEARERGILDEEAYHEARLKVQEEYNREAQRLNQEEVRMRQQTFQMLGGLLTQFGQKSKVAAIAAVALNAAQRVSEIQANTAAAAVRALAELGPIAGPPAAAKIKTYGMIQTGIALASAALNASSAGGGGAPSISAGGRGSSESGSGGGGASPSTTFNMRFVNDPFGIGEQIAREISSALSESQRNGTRLLINVSGGNR